MQEGLKMEGTWRSKVPLPTENLISSKRSGTCTHMTHAHAKESAFKVNASQRGAKVHHLEYQGNQLLQWMDLLSPCEVPLRACNPKIKDLTPHKRRLEKMEGGKEC